MPTNKSLGLTLCRLLPPETVQPDSSASTIRTPSSLTLTQIMASCRSRDMNSSTSLKRIVRPSTDGFQNRPRLISKLAPSSTTASDS